MRSQIVKRVNVNLTNREIKSLEILSNMRAFGGWTKSDLIRQAINVYSRKMQEVNPETNDDEEEPEYISESDDLTF